MKFESTNQVAQEIINLDVNGHRRLKVTVTDDEGLIADIIEMGFDRKCDLIVWPQEPSMPARRIIQNAINEGHHIQIKFVG